MTLLRIIRGLPDPAAPTPKLLGVDEFAIRRGQTYATILLDMATHRPIDVLDGRRADTFADWLRQHPGVRVICRDRSGAYAEGARQGAPEAIQVADRFHLWANLGEAVEKTVFAHRGCLAEPEIEPDETASTVDAQHDAAPVEDADPAATSVAPPHHDGLLDVSGRPRRLVARSIERFEAVQALRAQGMSLRAITVALDLDRKTVRRFADMPSLDELLFKATHRVSKLDRYKPYLDHRAGEGCTNAVVLFAELKAMGYTGSDQTVRRYVAPLRPKHKQQTANSGKTAAPTVRPAPPKPRRVARWIMTRPDRLKPGETVALKQILARCPQLEATAGHVTGFAAMMSERSGAQQLDGWMHAILADDLPALHSLVNGMRRDHTAILNGLSLPYSSGAVEGAVTRAKAIKRAYYGRANLDLLRKRVLPAWVWVGSREWWAEAAAGKDVRRHAARMQDAHGEGS